MSSGQEWRRPGVTGRVAWGLFGPTGVGVDLREGPWRREKLRLEAVILQLRGKIHKIIKALSSLLCFQLCSLLNVQPDFKISAEGSGLSF